MRPCTFEEPNGNITILKEIINPIFPAARNCAVPACESCMLERAKKRLTNNNKVNPLAEKVGALLCDKIKVGDFFQLVNLFVRLLVVYLLVMVGSRVIVVFKEILFIFMPLLVWFGLKIKSI